MSRPIAIRSIVDVVRIDTNECDTFASQKLSRGPRYKRMPSTPVFVCSPMQVPISLNKNGFVLQVQVPECIYCYLSFFLIAVANNDPVQICQGVKVELREIGAV